MFSTKKTTSRLVAVQAIYQYEINEQKQTADSIINSIIEFYASQDSLEDFDEQLDKLIKFNIEYARELITYTIDNITQIDMLIEQYLSDKWSIAKIDITLLSFLRVGVCELKYFPETPYKVVINEFTNIASDLLKDNDIGFVNSLLDNVRKEFRTT